MFWPLLCCYFSEDEEAAGQVLLRSSGLNYTEDLIPALPLTA